MSINQWRPVKYTDDGCSLYQCLMCYQTWEGRTLPGLIQEYDEKGNPIDPIYIPIFKYCPFCRTEWEGKRLGYPHSHNERSFGERRFKLQQLTQDKYRNTIYPVWTVYRKTKYLTWKSFIDFSYFTNKKYILEELNKCRIKFGGEYKIKLEYLSCD